MRSTSFTTSLEVVPWTPGSAPGEPLSHFPRSVVVDQVQGPNYRHITEHSTTTPRTDRASMCGRNSDHDPCKQHRATHTILCAHAPAQQLEWLRQVARRCIRAQRRLPWREHPAYARAGALRPPCDHTGSLRGGCNHRPPHPFRAHLSPSSPRRVPRGLVKRHARMGEHTYGPPVHEDGGCHLCAPTIDCPLADFGGRRVR